MGKVGAAGLWMGWMDEEKGGSEERGGSTQTGNTALEGIAIAGLRM